MENIKVSEEPVTNSGRKLNVNCGTVYLEGYVNIHKNPDRLSCLFPEDVENNKTTVDNLYKEDTFFNKKIVADIDCTLEELYEKIIGSSFDLNLCYFDEICMIHTIEELDEHGFDKEIERASSMLTHDGCLRIAVTDIDGVISEYAERLKDGISEEEKEWYYNYIYRSGDSYKLSGYNKQRLIETLKKHNFDRFEELPNQNSYPCIYLLAYKKIEDNISFIRKTMGCAIGSHIAPYNSSYSIVLGDQAIVVDGKDVYINGGVYPK